MQGDAGWGRDFHLGPPIRDGYCNGWHSTGKKRWGGKESGALAALLCVAQERLDAHHGWAAEMAERAIVGFHQDEHGDWVAELDCGHGQHVRHRPLWEIRPWVLAEEGRKQHMGKVLRCVRCDEDVRWEPAGKRSE
jgi:hypothetical protein